MSFIYPFLITRGKKTFQYGPKALLDRADQAPSAFCDLRAK